jgi:hypothetical protein
MANFVLNNEGNSGNQTGTPTIEPQGEAASGGTGVVQLERGKVFQPEGVNQSEIDPKYVARMEQLLAQGWDLKTVLFRVLGMKVADSNDSV